MKFGYLPDISHVDFTLPADHPDTLPLLQRFKTQKAPEVHIGLPVWVNKAWVGPYYPAGMPEKDSLLWYGRQFNTIELNSTHYHIPSAATIERWLQTVPPQFRFCPKFPQLISHEAALRSSQSITAAFCAAIAGLEERLGESFLQLPPTFSPRHLPDLEAFARFMPDTIPYAVELRHPDWFTDKDAAAAVFAVLENYGAGAVLTDVAGRRDMLHMRLTRPSAMIRFVGNGLHPTDYTRIDDWVARLKVWFENGLQQLYFFVHEPDNTVSPELATYFINQLNNVCGFDIKPPKRLVQQVQGELF